MKSSIAALVSGLLFGAGLIISGMANPAKVLGFLNITGLWDPTLAFVMGGALITTTIGYRLATKRPKPLFADSFNIPTNTVIDKKLILGAVLFGLGWGIAGLCPGPAIVGLATANTDIIIFVAAMLVGMLAFSQFEKKVKPLS